MAAYAGTSLAMQGNWGMGNEYERNGPTEYGGPGGYYPVPGAPADPPPPTGAPIGYGAPGGYGGYTGYEGYGEYDDGYGYDGYADGSRPAVHWGVICGIVLAIALVAPFVVIEVAYPDFFSHPDLAAQSISTHHDYGIAIVVDLVTLLSVLITPVALFFTGFLTTRETGTVGSGAFAGALAGFIAFVVYIFGTIFLILVMHLTLPWDQVSALAHVVVGVTIGSSFLLSSCCGLFIFTLPPALIAALGAGLARLIWGPAEG